MSNEIQSVHEVESGKIYSVATLFKAEEALKELGIYYNHIHDESTLKYSSAIGGYVRESGADVYFLNKKGYKVACYTPMLRSLVVLKKPQPYHLHED